MSFIQERSILPKNPEHHIPVGSVFEVSRDLVIDDKGRTFNVVEVEVGDQSDSEVRERFYQRAEAYERLLEAHPEWEAPYVNELGELVVDPSNMAAVDLYYDEHGYPTQMTEWGSQIMQAIALEGLQNLDKGGRFLSLGRLDRRTLELFTNMPDGIGLRSRQHIYSNLLVDYARTAQDKTLRMISLGAGAAVPNIEATQRVERELGKALEWDMYDIDRNALMYAEQLTNEQGFQSSTFAFGPKALEPTQEGSLYEGRSYTAAREYAPESVDVVDALGLWEYLTPRQAEAFLKMLYPKLKPGGKMIVSNMLITRPQPEYNRRAVGWPRLFMRSESDLVDIVESVAFADGSGIPLENVTITKPTDGVYAVMEITKQ